MKRVQMVSMFVALALTASMSTGWATSSGPEIEIPPVSLDSLPYEVSFAPMKHSNSAFIIEITCLRDSIEVSPRFDGHLVLRTKSRATLLSGYLEPIVKDSVVSYEFTVQDTLIPRLVFIWNHLTASGQGMRTFWFHLGKLHELHGNDPPRYLRRRLGSSLR
jgi:hypothetical protein